MVLYMSLKILELLFKLYCDIGIDMIVMLLQYNCKEFKDINQSTQACNARKKFEFPSKNRWKVP